jgi:hypothetical protein
MQAITIELFNFNELSDDAKNKAIEKFKNDTYYLDYDWWYSTCDDIKTMLEFIGFTDANIQFSGFCSQGDGASFTGNYEYAKGGVKKLIEYAPNETVFIGAAKQLQELQRKYFYKIYGKVERISNYYVHENTIAFSLDYHSVNTLQSVSEIEKEITEIVRTISQEIYSKLENEYEYLMSDEAIVDYILGNEYKFTIDGEIY